MCSKTELDSLITNFVEEMKNIFGDTLKNVILYGSYARGDYTDSSDVDIMVVADLDETEVMKYVYTVADYLGDLLIDYDVVISPVVESHGKFQKYKDVIPFLKNVQKEGIDLVS